MVRLWEILQTLGNGKAPRRTIIKDELEESLSLDGLHLGEGRVELSDEEAAIRQGVYPGSLRILIEIIRVEIGSNSPC